MRYVRKGQVDKQFVQSHQVRWEWGQIVFRNGDHLLKGLEGGRGKSVKQERTESHLADFESSIA